MDRGRIPTFGRLGVHKNDNRRSEVSHMNTFKIKIIALILIPVLYGMGLPLYKKPQDILIAFISNECVHVNFRLCY